MRFVLDHDVDADVGRMLRREGHQCMLVGAAGLATASDDAVSVFADNLHAVLITHDRELIERRKKNTFGQHVLMKCDEPDAAEVLRAHLPAVVELVGHCESVVVRVSKDGVRVYPAQWT